MRNTILQGDAIARLAELPAGSVQCCITSPPYWGLRSYLPDAVQLREDVPVEILEELARLNIFPVDPTGG